MREEDGDDLDIQDEELLYYLALHGIPLGKRRRKKNDEDEDNEEEESTWSGAPIDLGARRKKSKDPLIRWLEEW